MLLGFSGIMLFQVNKEKADAIKQLELIKQREEAEAKAAEEKRRAEEVAKQKEIEKQKTIGKEQDLLNQQAERERRKEQEKLAKERERQDEQERKQRQAEEKRRRAEAEKRAQEEQRQRQLTQEKERERREKTSRFQVTLDPNKASAVPVAHVHAGDQITLNIRRIGGAEEKLYAGLVPMNTLERINREAQNPPRGGSSGRPRKYDLLTTPIKDREQFTVSSGFNLGGGVGGSVEGREGAVLFVGNGMLNKSLISGALFGTRKGEYRIDIEVFADNRWNINARALR